MNKSKLFLLLVTFIVAFAAHAQQRQLSGRVIGAGDKFPLPGVTVLLKGTTIGTATDNDGKFSIAVPASGGAVLVFSFVGYDAAEVSVGNDTNVEVALKEKATSLSDVVVVGYGTQRRGSVTGSVATVKSDDISKSAVTGVGQALQGKVSGVQITRTSGAPGAGVDIRIRGEGTLNSGKGPLVIVDGIEGQDLNTISPKDIDNITVLKDASASAIYGSRAANGVIVVTTKRGVVGKTVVDYSYAYGVSQITRKPKLLNAHDFVRLQNESIINAGGLPTWNDEQIAAFGDGTDWLKAILRNGIRQEHNISVNGGSEKVRYLIAANYLDETGIVAYSSFKRITGRVNLDAKLNDKISVGLNAFVFNSKSPTSAQINYSSAIEFVPTIPLTNPDGTPGYRLPGGPTNAENGGLNPLQAAAIGADYTNNGPTTGTNSSLFVEYSPFSFLKFRSTGGLNLSYNHSQTFLPSYSIVDSKGVTVAERLPQQRQLTETDRLNTNWIVNNVLTFTKAFGDHNTSALLGHSEQYSKSEFNSLQRTNFPSNQFLVLDAGSNLLDRVVGNVPNESSLRSFFGRVNYDFKQRYLFELVGRYDGSSRFSPSRKYGFFPSASVGWRISDEPFFAPFTKSVNELKLRASYGAIGNEAIPNFVYLQSASLNNPYYLNNNTVQGVAYDVQKNPDIKWETALLGDVGLDMGFFQNKLTVTVDAYNKLTKDILTNVPIPATTGFFGNDVIAATQIRNVGQVRNRGLELFTGYSDSWGKDVKYSVSFTGAYNENKVVSLGEPGTVIYGDAGRSITTVGSPVGSVYGYRSIGVWQNAKEIAEHPHQVNDQPGDLRLADLNGDGKVDSADKEVLGSSVPKYTVGVNGNVSYKNFDFNVSTQGDYGRQILRYAVGGYFELAYTTRNNFDYVLNRWRGEGTSNTIPRVVNSEYNTGEATSLRVQNASYFKVRHLEMGYTIPQSLTQKVKLTSVRVYAAGENLFLFTPFVGLDPERPGTVQRQNETYPQAKTYLFGMNVRF